MRRTEPEIPSIRTPLAHESSVTAAIDPADLTHSRGQTRPGAVPERTIEIRRHASRAIREGPIEPTTDARPGRATGDNTPDDATELHQTVDRADCTALVTPVRAVQRPERTWPDDIHRDLNGSRTAADKIEPNESHAWEP